MKTISILLLLSLFTELWANPTIYFPEATKDFGKMLPSKKINHTFVVKNTGSEKLLIKEVKPSCGCTIVQGNHEQTIEPGMAGSISIEFTAPSHEGQTAKTVVVTSNDPKNPNTTITLKATIKSDFAISQSRFDFGTIYWGDTKEYKVIITPTNGIPFSPDHIDYANGDIKLESKMLEKDNPLSAYELNITYTANPNRPPRRAYDKIKLYPYKQKGLEDSFLEIVFTGFVSGDILIDKSSVYTTLKIGESHTEIITLTHRKNQPFEVLDLKSTNEKMPVELKKINDSKYEILVKTSDQKMGKRETTTITFKSNKDSKYESKAFVTFGFRP